ncbi:MAG: response regulator [Flavobacteriales bacterium]|jgi:response regulator RpfG family c-di-GMP phosphodiesterase|nr:response regulator [Flavobacteriales bacterium]MBK9513001.1 response regulator [Flavobacteriales bacterium]HOZ41194.1 response regulator [Flavobacteriales bacterium]
MNTAHSLPQAAELPRVLFVDDDAGNRQAFKAAFRHAMEVLVASNSMEALTLLERQQVHVVITDQRMPGASGSEFLAAVKERFPAVRRMLVTGYADLEAIIEAVNSGGVSKYFAKPWVNDQLVKAVEQAYSEFKDDVARTSYTQRLEESNRQLEFALRQRLLS